MCLISLLCTGRITVCERCVLNKCTGLTVRLSGMHTTAQEWASKDDVGPELVFLTRVPNSHSGITYLPRASASFSILSSFLTGSCCPGLRLFTVIGIPRNQCCESMEILSPAGNYLPTSFDLPARSDAVSCYWICFLSHKLLLSIASQHFIFSKNYHRRTYQKFNNMSVQRASVFPLSLLLQVCF